MQSVLKMNDPIEVRNHFRERKQILDKPLGKVSLLSNKVAGNSREQYAAMDLAKTYRAKNE